MSSLPSPSSRFLWLWLLIFSTLVAADTPDFTSQERAWIKAHPQITFGADYSWAPYDFVNTQGHHAGIAADFLKLVSQKSGLKIDVVPDRWAKTLARMKAGGFDGLTCAVRTDEREHYLDFTRPYLSMPLAIFVRSGTPGIDGIASLSGRSVSINAGSYLHEWLSGNHPEIRIVPVDSNDEALQKVAFGEADAYIGNIAVASYIIKHKFLSNLVIAGRLDAMDTAVSIAVAKGKPLLRSILQKSLDAVTKEEREAIVRRWYDATQMGVSGSGTGLNLSEEQRAWIDRHPRVRVAVETDWAPFDFVDSAGAYRGIARDYLELVSKMTGLSFTYTPDRWARNLEKLKRQETDLLPALYYSAERAESMHFTSPYFGILNYFFIRSDLKAQQMEDLAGKRVAMPKGYYLEEVIKSKYPALQLYPVESFDDALNALVEKKADILFDNFAVVNYTLKQKGISTIVPFKTHRSPEPVRLYMAAAKEKPMLAEIISAALEHITPLEKQRIAERWTGSGAQQLGRGIALSALEQAWLAEHPTVSFRTLEQWMPYGMLNDEGECIGIVNDYLKSMETMAPVVFKPKVTDAAALLKGKPPTDLVFGGRGDRIWDKHYRPAKAYSSTPVVIVMKTGAAFVDKLDDLKGRRVAVVDGYSYANLLYGYYDETRFQKVPDLDTALQRLLEGDDDALLLPMPVASHAIRTLTGGKLQIVGKTDVKLHPTLFVRRDEPVLYGIIMKLMENIPQNSYDKIFGHWQKVQFAQKTDYTLLLQVGGLLLLFAVGTLYWNRKLSREIEERKQVEEALRQEKENFQAMFDKVAYTNLILQNGVIVDCNDAAWRILGLPSREKLIGTTPLAWAPIVQGDGQLSETKAAREIARALKDGHNRFEWLVCDADGNRIWADTVLTKLYYRGKEALLVSWHDISAQKQHQKELAEARKAAEAANRSKSEFLSNMSHEIRTPMNAIIGFTELLGEQLKTPRLQAYVKTIRSAGNTLLMLINDILDLSKIEAGKLALSKKPTDLRELFNDVATIFSMAVRQKGLELIVDIDDEVPPSLLLDDTRLRQVLFNLIGNAVKFTEAGQIRLELRILGVDEHHSKVDLLMRVKDTGIGIPKDQLRRIFNAFEQMEGQDSRQYGGTGLGLAITSRLVEMMTGNISVESSKNEGSTFTIELYDVDIASVASESRSMEKVDEFDPSRIVFKPARVLVVDDVEDNRALVASNFEDTPVVIETAANGREAVALCGEHDFDLIIMDIRMPVMDGYEAASRIKAEHDVPIIALTASVMQGDFDQRSSEHFNGYLRKPVLRKDLFDAVHRFLPYEIHQEPVRGTTEREGSELPECSDLEAFISELEGKTETAYEQAVQTNSMSDVRVFAEQLLKVAERYDAKRLVQLASNLFEALDAFDIVAIQAEMKRYLEEVGQMKAAAPGEHE